ncbi:MAG: hypothetical protein DRI69_03905 [Bacteroidetes bacterium]|nr:MAG: hypothetical protein DRI69_03905 [Bacteroidota bacterium]
MFKILPLFLFSLFLLSCGNEASKKGEEDSTTTSVATDDDASRVGYSNYAVIWTWTTENVQLVYDNSVEVANELTELWKKGVVENAYYDSESKEERLEYFPNIAFFILAPSAENAGIILDELTIVRKGIATYSLHPVGQLWLGRNEDVVRKYGITKSFVTIWTTRDGAKPSPELIQTQNDEMLELWNKGAVENVYFDFEGTHSNNSKTDFVFFVNADSEQAARSICNALPFTKENLATYKIKEAGVFWMGQYKNR